MDQLLKGIARDWRIKFIGDNLNFKIKENSEKLDHHTHMENLLAFAALISPVYYTDRPKKVQIKLDDLKPEDLIPSMEEMDIVIKDLMIILLDILAKFVPQLNWMRDYFPAHIIDDKESGKYTDETVVVPLPVYNLNEISYKDVVQILDKLQTIIRNLIKEGNLPQNTKFDFGGGRESE